MSAVAAPFLAACALLAAGGALKAIRPDDTARALRTMRVPLGVGGVRVAGAVEAVLGVLAVATGSALAAAAVAVSYLGFAAIVLVAVARQLPISSCGCFGAIETPPTWLHVGVNLGAAAVAAVAAADSPGSLARVLEDQPAAGIPFLVLAGVIAYAAALAMTDLPKARALRVRRTP